jgi:hypothetical protein
VFRLAASAAKILKSKNRSQAEAMSPNTAGTRRNPFLAMGQDQGS